VKNDEPKKDFNCWEDLLASHLHFLTRKSCNFLCRIVRYIAGGIRTCDLLLTHSLLNHSTHHSLMSILELGSPHIIQMEKLSTTKLHNVLRSTTFILVVSPSKVIYNF